MRLLCIALGLDLHHDLWYLLQCLPLLLVYLPLLLTYLLYSFLHTPKTNHPMLFLHLLQLRLHITTLLLQYLQCPLQYRFLSLYSFQLFPHLLVLTCLLPQLIRVLLELILRLIPRSSLLLELLLLPLYLPLNLTLIFLHLLLILQYPLLLLSHQRCLLLVNSQFIVFRLRLSL